MLLQSPLYKVVEIKNPKTALVKKTGLTKTKVMKASKDFTLLIEQLVLLCEQQDPTSRPSQLKSELKLYQTSQYQLKQKLNLKLNLLSYNKNCYNK